MTNMILLLQLLIASTAYSLDNGLGLTPRLAYSTWNFYGTSASEADVHAIAASLQRTGLKDLGYTTINIDAGSLNRDPTTGKLVENRHHFPSGLRNLSDFLHGAGFQFGAYNDISGHTCGQGPAAGSLHHYEADAEVFAHDWQVDYLKFDFCGVQMPGSPPENCTGVVGRSCGCVPVNSTEQYAAWAALTRALNKTGRPIYLDFCPHAIADGIGTEVPKGKLMYAPPKDWTLPQRRALSNSLLVEYDNTQDAWNWHQSSGLIFNIDAMVKATDLSYSGPGMWNYADMLQICSYGKGNTPGDGMTLGEYRAHYSVWSVLASPLIIGTDLVTVERDHPDCLALLKNEDIVKVNQDQAALSARLVSQIPPFGSLEATTLNISAQVFARPLSGGRLAVVLLNRGPVAASLSVSWRELGIANGRAVQVYNVIKRHSAGSATNSFTATVPSHDVEFVIFGHMVGEKPLHGMGVTP
eukprot:CAMPEP_0119341642 /NCGR_PEP_ID=MMETSP1333-20130426/102897_1 /TAXON_ID=418940 /ORGANISM="Scyphosphaera apsteinii, Strain RCC1455" /LENGTH=468 /DNA_ID=CAMNT_0007353669 /DNA_START=59 /DNA_END=1466 /DNA_ORIENTATION=-